MEQVKLADQYTEEFEKTHLRPTIFKGNVL